MSDRPMKVSPSQHTSSQHPPGGEDEQLHWEQKKQSPGAALKKTPLIDPSWLVHLEK